MSLLEAMERRSCSTYGEFEVLDDEQQDAWRKKTPHPAPMIRFKETGTIMTSTFLNYAERIHGFEAKEEDVWIISFPKAGSTWMCELVWCLRNSLDFEMAKSKLQEERVPFLEMSALSPKPGTYDDSIQISNNYPCPRTLKSHLPFNMLPKALHENKSKIVYVLRNPRDVCVSLFNHLKIWNNYEASFEEHVDFFLADCCGYYFPYFENIRDYVKKSAHSSNILLITYESMIKDLRSTIEQVGDFLGRPRLEADSMEDLVLHLDFKTMKNNPTVNRVVYIKKDGFMNKGIVGNWRSHLTDDMIQRFEGWEAKHLGDLNIQFDYNL